MKTTGVRDIPKFGLLFFLGHPIGHRIVVDLNRRNVTWLIVPTMTWFATPAFPLRDLFHVRRPPTSAPSAEFDLFGGSSASFNTLATSLSIVTGTAVFPWRRNLGMPVQAGFLAGMIMSVG